jgi:hypothetical protein
MYEVSKYHPELIPRRQCTISPQSVKVAEATGIMDYAAYRRQRRADLTRMLKSARGDINRMALQKRATVPRPVRRLRVRCEWADGHRRQAE